MPVADQQGAGGLLADQHLVARLDVLQARGQRAVLHLDAEELQVLFPVGAGDGVRAQQRPRLGFQADHHELAVLEAESAVAGEGEAEVGIGPVTDLKHRFGAKSGGHGRIYRKSSGVILSQMRQVLIRRNERRSQRSPPACSSNSSA
ncbi:hypothetical protein G6F31_020550 [Rhizopus arrhizus]|nr:hypothetical protein G6F31_020550 [Rhizopus arrhizus]